jgi:predicted cupin superfamily sugar epimerase
MKPSFTPDADGTEAKEIATLIRGLGLMKHIEGGYFAEIDRNPLKIPNPFLPDPGSDDAGDALVPGRTALIPRSGDDSARNASTSIYYLITPTTPTGHFHRNKGRTVHTLIRGRGTYVLIHADEEGVGGKKRVESFVVGRDVEKGERMVWVVEGGKYKATFLLEGDGDGLLVSEVSVWFL